MIGERCCLENITPFFNNYVTFGDNAKGKIIGKGGLDYHGLPCLNDVFLFDGIIINLISIIQLCDPELSSNFTIE